MTCWQLCRSLLARGLGRAVPWLACACMCVCGIEGVKHGHGSCQGGLPALCDLHCEALDGVGSSKM